MLASALLALALPRVAHADGPGPDSPPVKLGFWDAGLRRAERPSNVVLADLGLHVIGVGAQRTLAPRFAVQLAADFYAPWTATPKATTMTGGLLRARGFVYPFGGAPAGLWVSPFVQYGIVSAERAEGRRIGSAWAFGASIGYTLLLGHRVAVGLGVGAQYHATYVFGDLRGSPGFAGLWPTADINVGYAF